MIKHRRTESAVMPPRPERKVFRPHLEIPDIRQFNIEKEEGGFRITGKRIEQMAIMTDMSKRGAIVRMYDVWKKVGIKKELIRMKAEEGDKVYIGERVFEFVE